MSLHLTEKQIELSIKRKIESINQNYKVLANQYRINKYNIIDILCLDKKDGSFVIVEVKICAQSSAINQILNYKYELESLISCKKQIKMILLSNSFTKNTQDLAKKNNINMILFKDEEILFPYCLNFYELDLLTKEVIMFLRVSEEPQSFEEIKKYNPCGPNKLKSILKLITLILPIKITEESKKFYSLEKNINHHWAKYLDRECHIFGYLG